MRIIHCLKSVTTYPSSPSANTKSYFFSSTLDQIQQYSQQMFRDKQFKHMCISCICGTSKGKEAHTAEVTPDGEREGER